MREHAALPEPVHVAPRQPERERHRLRLAPRLQALAERLALFLGARNHREARPREAFREAVLDEAPDVTELLQVNLAVLVLVDDLRAQPRLLVPAPLEVRLGVDLLVGDVDALDALQLLEVATALRVALVVAQREREAEALGVAIGLALEGA